MPAPEQPSGAPTTFMGHGAPSGDDQDLAQEAIDNDMEIDPEDAEPSSSDPSPEPYDTSSSSRDDDDETLIRPNSNQRRYSLSSSYNRPSFIASGASRSTVVSSLQHTNSEYLTRDERDHNLYQERALLRDNNIIPKRSRRPSTSSSYKDRADSWLDVIKRKFSGDTTAVVPEEVGPDDNEPSETTPLMQNLDLPINDDNHVQSEETINQKWDEALEHGKIHTTWQRELKVLFRSSRSLILAFILQYSIPVTSIFMVGHLGTTELGAVSLGSMTCSITGYAIYIGLSTSLDTLCAQAYGSGRKKLVGLQTQRMVFFLWTVTIPIGIVWLCGTWILQAIVPEKETARMAGLYLKIALIGAPGYAAFESGKRFMQAQGLFAANLCVLLFCAPLNIFLQWLFVYRIGLGYIGAPMGLAITELCMPTCLALYVYFINGSECWGGFAGRAAFQNWWPMVRLALPGMAMVEAEFLCFEILALSASWISGLHLATNSILMSICACIYQIPFPISVCASNRIANLIGATLAGPARTAAKVSMVVACCVGVFNMVMLASLRKVIPALLTSEQDVIDLASKVLLVCAGFQFFDATAAFCNGVLRGIGKQEFGGYVALVCYYGVGLPISFGTCFGLGWDLYGLWAGPAIALALTVFLNGAYILRTDWDKCVEEAKQRNSVT